MADAEGALRGMYAMQDVRDSLEDLFPERGLVRSEQYELAKAALRRCKEQFIERVARTDEEKAVWRESWPFDD
jgi:replication fork clamp-binding protein CrfC